MERTPLVYAARPIKGWRLVHLSFPYDSFFHEKRGIDPANGSPEKDLNSGGRSIAGWNVIGE